MDQKLQRKEGRRPDQHPYRSGETGLNSIHIDLDGAWTKNPIAALPHFDATFWGPRLRYCAPVNEIEAFYKFIQPKLAPFILYGSGDFHHLAGLWLRAAIARSQPKSLAIVSFDNHPDWDKRPPRWGCGGWLNRALELPSVLSADVWGCGNFELRWPARIFANRSGRLKIHAWAERQPPAVQRRFNCMTRENWRDRFDNFASTLKDRDVYVTVDLDCLKIEESATNWENGLFTASDLAWAIGRLRSSSKILAGDLCGAWSKQEYSRFRQRFAGKWDHPRIAEPDSVESLNRNKIALSTIWPALTGAIDP